MKSHPMTFKDIGWNGICFSIPDTWEVSKIGAHYLFFEDQHQPTMEIKWGKVPEGYTHHQQFQQLSTQYSGQEQKTIKQNSLPKLWEKALHAYDAVGFSWGGKPFGGTGAMVYCPECRCATLIQFFSKDRQPVPAARQILQSFKDHPESNLATWSIYDIQAKIPTNFTLITYQFDAGCFKLVFDTGFIRATFHRWGLASVLLRDKNLQSFARQMCQMPASEPDSIPIHNNAYTGVHWRVSPPNNLWVQLANLIKRSRPYRSTLFWQVPEKNRILGIDLAGKGPMDESLMNTLCAGYDTI
jgi:hypothetical protein